MSKGNPIQLEAARHIASLWVGKWQAIQEEPLEYHICGSIRRKERMVRDIDVLIIDPEMHGKFQRGAKFEGVELNLCFTRKESEGAGMLFLTGNYKFNISLRSQAKSMGMKLNRYGLWRGDELVAADTEHKIFKALKMHYIEPEHRSSPDGQKGITVMSSQIGNTYEVFIEEVHGFNFCECKGFQYRRHCGHLAKAAEKV